MKSQTTTLIGMALVSLVFLLTSPLIQMDPGVVTASILLLALCVGPIMYWVYQGMHGMPLFELFAGMHLFYYWLSFGRDTQSGDADKHYDSLAIWVVCVFLFMGMLAYYGVISRLRRGRQIRWKWLDMRAGSTNGLMWAWLMLAGAVMFEFAVQSNLIWQFLAWENFRPVQTLFSAFAMLGIFRLTVELGSGALPVSARIALFALIGVQVILHTISGFLAMAGLTAMVGGFGFMVSARRLPILAFVVCLVVGSFLNLGKREWRSQHWSSDVQAPILERVENFVYFSWLALNERVTQRAGDEGGAETLIERGNLGQNLYRITNLTPRLIPYMQGDSYSYGLTLAFVPRFLQAERGNFLAAMTEAATVYGFLTTSEVALETNISLGPIAEAWMNGGWLVVMAVGTCFGLLFALGVALAWDRAFDSLGYLSGVFFFSTLFSAMELFVGPMLMGLTRNYPLALATLLALALAQRVTQSTRPLRQGPARVAPVPAPQPTLH